MPMLMQMAVKGGVRLYDDERYGRQRYVRG